MDTTSTAPTPPMPPTPTPPRPTVTGWWRRPLADVLDVAVVALAGLLVGGGVAAALLADASDDAWAELGAVLLGVGAGVVAAVATWVRVLVAIASRGTSPGSRAVGLSATRSLAAAGRHLAVVVVLWAALGIATAATEPWPAGPLAGAFGAAVATAATRVAWGSGPWRTRWRTVGIAAVVGLLLAGAVPDRAPYHWELRQDAEDAIVAALVDDPAARRVCDVMAAGGGGAPLASHATAPCHDPDREWLVDRHATIVAEQLAVVATEVVGGHASVRIDDTRAGREVLFDVLPVATVVARGSGCATVVVGAGAPTTAGQVDTAACRWTS